MKPKSQYTGVSHDPSSGKWRARIRIDGRERTIGRFKTELEAARAYDDEYAKAFKGGRPNKTQPASQPETAITSPTTRQTKGNKENGQTQTETRPQAKSAPSEGQSTWTMDFDYAASPAQARLPNT